MNTEPRSWHVQRWIWTVTFVGLAALFVIKSYPIQERKASHFSKQKEARRGKIRLAREGKGNFTFTQHRLGVTRKLWIEDDLGLRRQFFLIAPSAQVSAIVSLGKTSFLEEFASPKGWLQEELYWEIPSTGDRVVQRGTRWVKEGTTQPIPESLYREIIPVQRARFFDAESAEWNPITNQLVAHTAFFSILKVRGHRTPLFYERWDRPRRRNDPNNYVSLRQDWATTRVVSRSQIISTQYKQLRCFYALFPQYALHHSDANALWRILPSFPQRGRKAR